MPTARGDSEDYSGDRTARAKNPTHEQFLSLSSRDPCLALLTATTSFRLQDFSILLVENHVEFDKDL
jgi:hypothetical protein